MTDLTRLKVRWFGCGVCASGLALIVAAEIMRYFQ